MRNSLRLLVVIIISILVYALFASTIVDSTYSQSNLKPVEFSPVKQVSPGSTSALTIVINEVAWAGTPASPYDEWIELYNNTFVSISLQGWRLYALDGGPDIQLQGTIEAQDYYLIERTDDDTISDIPADLIAAFGNGLNNTGDILLLAQPDAHIVDTVNLDGGSWPNTGDTSHSLERINTHIVDNEDNWASNNGTQINGLDANSLPISGTPRSANSVSVDLEEYTDLAINKQGPDNAQSLEIITYTFTISNQSSLPAAGTIITEYIPAHTNFIAEDSPFAVTHYSQTVVWDAGTVIPQSHLTWTVSLQISDSAAQQITNHVTCTSLSPETQLWNNSDSQTTMVDASRMLISGVMFDGYQFNDQDEAIELTNISQHVMDISGWELCKQTTTSIYCTEIPTFTMDSGKAIWLARNADAFTASFGQSPDIVLPAWIGLSNSGTVLYLRDSNSVTIDTLVYGNTNSQAVGWSGPNLLPYYNSMRGITGQILKRIPDEITGFPITDSDTYVDWMQNTEDPLTGRRVWYPGWTMHPFFWPLTTLEQAEIVVGIAPDSAFEVVSETLIRAHQSISISAYTLNNPQLLPILKQKAIEGVQIKVLLEGDPVGVAELSKEWQTQLYICSEIEKDGAECWFMIHDPEAYIYNRYEFLHSKTMIVDNEWVILGSQNFTPDSLPADDKTNGTYGTRGSIIATNAPSVVDRARIVFAHDSDSVHYTDLRRWNTGSDSRYLDYHSAWVDLSATDYFSYTPQFPQPLRFSGEVEFETFTSPESSLRQSDTILGLLEQADVGDSILVQQMYEHASWGGNPEEEPNLRLQAYINAARKGALVRILLNGHSYIPGSTTGPEENLETIAYINRIASEERLNLLALLGNPTGAGIHNKMILVDLGQGNKFSHIGSINGSEGSSKVNREIAVQMKSELIYNYLRDVFHYDWWMSSPVFLPFIVRNLIPPPPHVDHIVVSEVFYTLDPAQEWIEIYNPTNEDILLDGWKIGDAESPTSYEAMFSFPLSTTIGSQAAIVIAVNASETWEADYEFYESSPSIPNMVPDPYWGNQDYPFSLRDSGDQVILMDGNYVFIDGVVWGDAVLPGNVAHPGKTMNSASLERYPPYLDSDNCLQDFRERYPPTPGIIPLP